ncbi:MAG: HI0074 family nucleotidyltransferase substrate-binding subunit [Vampirovibrionia bacterium]
MSKINLEYFTRCMNTLEKAFSSLAKFPTEDELYDIYRAACVKEFELIIEQSVKLLRRSLKPYFALPRELDTMNFKDVFRSASKHGLLSLEETERWFKYRDSRNETAHDYGVNFANETLSLIPEFIIDANKLAETVEALNEAA